MRALARHEGVLGYAAGWYTLVRCSDKDGRSCAETRPCAIGETIEVWVDGRWQKARLESGGYRGWYLVLPDERCVRPALCMRVLVL
jgi:hypothetical protein